MNALAALLVVGGIAATLHDVLVTGPPLAFSQWDGPVLSAVGIAVMFRALTRD